MKITNFDEDYLDELENKEFKNKYKYKTKRAKESFAFEDLLNSEQKKKILQYAENGGTDV